MNTCDCCIWTDKVLDEVMLILTPALELSGYDVDCRVFEYNGENYEVPPEKMLANDILCSIFGNNGGGCSCGSKYELPENLKSSFEGKIVNKEEPS